MTAARYFTGVPCKRGHVAERFVKGGHCLECGKENAARRRKIDPIGTRNAVRWAHALYGDRYRAGKQKADTRWRHANPAVVREINQRSYARIGSAYWRAARAKRRAAELRQMPRWANVRDIEKIYAWCPQGHHVDHAIPLRGKLVSGLHVESNLQYLPATENRRKHNSFEVSP